MKEIFNQQISDQASSEPSTLSPLPFLGSKNTWMLGRTPPDAIVTELSNLLSSSSFLIASWICLGTIRVFLLSRAAFPASSSTSAAKYSSTAARYTGAPAPTRSANLPYFMKRAIRPTGNCNPALADLLTGLAPPLDFPLPPLPFPAIRSFLI